jgi:hypothetical protein
MRNILITAVAALQFCTPAHAMSRVEFCNSVAGMAGNIMQARQNGVSYENMMALVNKQTDREARRLGSLFVSRAYLSTVFKDEGDKFNARRNFKEDAQFECERGMLGGTANALK